MIDTIALKIEQSDFEILDHDRFSPCTKNLFEPPYIKVNAGKLFGAYSNPTAKDIEKYGYLPRLTLFKALRRGGFQIFLHIEASYPKLIKGNNLDELEEFEFGEVCWKLNDSVKVLGVEIPDIKKIMYAKVASIHYSKNIILTDYSTPHTYMKEFSKININRLLDINQTDYRNSGHSVKYRSTGYEVIFYDKIEDLKQAKISEKRSIEKDNYAQLNLFDKIKNHDPFEVLRFEIRIGNRKKLKQVLAKNNILNSNMTFNDLFCKNISQKLLLSELDRIENAYPVILKTSEPSLSDYFTSLQLNNINLGPEALLKYTGLQALIKESGIREVRKLLQRFGDKKWYRLNKQMKDLNYGPKTEVFKTIRTALEEFETVKLEKYIEKM